MRMRDWEQYAVVACWVWTAAYATCTDTICVESHVEPTLVAARTRLHLPLIQTTMEVLQQTLVSIIQIGSNCAI